MKALISFALLFALSAAASASVCIVKNYDSSDAGSGYVVSCDGVPKRSAYDAKKDFTNALSVLKSDGYTIVSQSSWGTENNTGHLWTLVK